MKKRYRSTHFSSDNSSNSLGQCHSEIDCVASWRMKHVHGVWSVGSDSQFHCLKLYLDMAVMGTLPSPLWRLTFSLYHVFFFFFFFCFLHTFCCTCVVCHSLKERLKQIAKNRAGVVLQRDVHRNYQQKRDTSLQYFVWWENVQKLWNHTEKEEMFICDSISKVS